LKIDWVFIVNIHAENTGTATDIEDDLVLEDVAVLVDGITVGSCTDIIFLRAGTNRD
jgi:hypothetical protein